MTPKKDGGCDGCCYNNNPQPNLNCNKIKCNFLKEDECLIKQKIGEI